MKYLSTIIASLALIGVIALFVKTSDKGGTKPKVISTTAAAGEVVAGANIAYLDIDTFEANYSLLKTKKEEFKSRQTREEAELERSAQQFQNDVMKYQNTGAGMSDAERQATEKRLGQMQQNIATRKGTMEEQFAKDQVKFQEFMHKELDAFFEEYNKDKHYDYIFAYSRSSAQIMYVNKELDITNDVIEGMNARNTTAPKDATQKTK